jgi:hypothetical protein
VQAPDCPTGISSYIAIEEALAAFELWLASHVGSVFRSDAWLILLTQKPVIWLPSARGARMLSSDMLLNILHSPFGVRNLGQLAEISSSRTTLHNATDFLSLYWIFHASVRS